MLSPTARMLGGAERYLSQMIAALAVRDVDVALVAEREGDATHEAIPLPDGTRRWVVGGSPDALAAVATWRPTLVIDHGVDSAATSSAVLAMAPSLLVTHDYRATCISGEKTHKSIVPRACGRPLGPACLAHFYPNRCGGLDPRTMVRDYRRARRRAERVVRGQGVIALSSHMSNEYVRQGVDPAHAHVVPPPVPAGDGLPGRLPAPGRGEPWRLAFVGRMDRLKGAHVLIDALPRAQRALGRPLSLTLVGTGTQVDELRGRATRITRATPDIRIDFDGWVAAADVRLRMARHHLLVMPSLWPEPYGLVGLEAASLGLPTVAFPVGGIVDWLSDGETGWLARGAVRNAGALSAALVRACEDPMRWATVGDAAQARARAMTFERFADRLVDVVTRHTVEERRSADR